MAEYVERSYIRKMAMLEPRYTMQTRYDSDLMLKLISEAPAADAAEVRHGKWIVLKQRTYGGGRSYTHYCSECGQHGFDDYKGCPGCLSKMEGGADNGTN